MSYTSRLKKIKNLPRWARFFITGLVNTGFSYLVYAFFLYLGLDYKLANFLAMATGILFSFKTHGHFVFQNTDNRLLVRYVLSWMVIYVSTILLISWFVFIGLNVYSAGALALPLSAALSYLIQKKLVFRPPPTT